MPSTFTIQALVFLLLYSLLILAFFFGWLRTKRVNPSRKPPETRVTILIPCRNESENIAALASVLLSQEYPENLLEIIWIDDHSTDGSSAFLEKLAANHPNFHMTTPENNASGKKAALKAGMKSATGELILLTDADSRPGTRWVFTMARHFEDSSTDLILGPVVLSHCTSMFGQVQKLEYMSLVASSVGAAGIGMPIMAQGPNIGVRASDYASIVNNLDNRFASGDDVFLLQAMKRIPGKKIGYLINPDAIVSAKPTVSMAAFIHQRSRWASKAKGYTDPFLILTTLLVFAANLEILIALVLVLTGLVPINLFLIFTGIKVVADLPVLLAAMRFFRSPGLLWWIIPVQLLYPVYVTIAGIISQTARVRWKDPV